VAEHEVVVADLQRMGMSTYEAKAYLALVIAGAPINGYEVAKHLRQDPRFQQAMLIAVTGYGQDDDRQRSKDAGFDHHLTKPVDPAKLQDLLVQWAQSATGNDSTR